MSKPKKRRSFYFTPELEKQFNLVTVPGTNVNSNTTNARKTGVQALNFLAQEAARKDAEIESRSERKTTKRQTTVGERLRGDNGYSSYMSGGTGMSGRDPLLGTIFDWTVGAKGIDALGKTALWNYAKYVPTSGLGKWGRNYFVNLAFKLELRKPILFGLGKNIAESAYVSSAPKPSDTGLTSLKFFERPTYLSPLELAGATRGERNFTPRWHVAKYPGYLLKGLMGGSPLERQISKNGTISINLLNAYFNKASQIEREVANKVLAEKFAGQKTIDYNLFKKAVLDELITYDVNPVQKYRSYGMDRLGFDIPATDLDIQRILLKKYPERFSLVKNDLDVIDRTLGTEYFVDRLLGRGWNRNSLFPFEIRREYMSLISNSGELYPEAIVNLFSSPRIPKGNATHYDVNTLGHSRIMATPEDPRTLYILESQSDWGLKSLGLTKAEKAAIQNIDEQLKTGTPTGFSTLEELQTQKQAILDKVSQRTLGVSYQAQHLHDNYLQRQLQENLKYAAESGLTKMRYPTSETAAKIEGYLSKTGWFTPEGQELDPLTSAQFNPVTGNFEAPVGTVIKPVYSPEHQTILKKYADFPKLFLKLYKGLNVRTVTDAKGNTWYEIDVPKGYLSREWQFKRGGKITINNIEI